MDPVFHVLFDVAVASTVVSTGDVVGYTVTTPSDDAGWTVGIDPDWAQTFAPLRSRGLEMDSLVAFLLAFVSVLERP